jgi:hypothetical protein
MNTVYIAILLLLLSTGAQASRASTENSPLGKEISQESLTGEEDSFIAPHSSYIVFVIASFAGLSVFTLFCIKSHRKHRPYAAGSSFTDSEAQDGELYGNNDNDMPEIMPLSSFTEGNNYGIGNDKLSIVTMIGGGGKDKNNRKDLAMSGEQSI